MFLSTANGIWREVPLHDIVWNFTAGMHSVWELKQSILKFSERNLSFIRWLETVYFKNIEAFNSEVDNFCTTKYSNTQIKYSNYDRFFFKNKILWSVYTVKGNSTLWRISFLFYFQNEILGKPAWFYKGFEGTAYSDGKWLLGMSLSSSGNESIHETFAEQVMSTELNYCVSFITHWSLDSWFHLFTFLFYG